MFFKKKKGEEKVEQKVEKVEEPRIPKFEVEVVTWDGKVINATMTSTPRFISFDEMIKATLRDGLFVEGQNRIVRVNEIRWKTKDEVKEAEEVMN